MLDKKSVDDINVDCALFLQFLPVLFSTFCSSSFPVLSLFFLFVSVSFCVSLLLFLFSFSPPFPLSSFLCSLLVKDKKVLVRCDFNVPLDAELNITDENRLVAALPTIKKLIADGGKVILCSHLGKPKGEPKPELSLAPVAKRLTELLGQEVKFAADPEVVGPNAKAAVEAMNDGDVILLENTRYRAEETKNGEAFSKDLASIADVFVNDAFGTAHRAHCSNVGVADEIRASNT